MKEGKPAIIMKEFWRDAERFADVFNAYFFQGEEIVHAEELQELDTDVSGTIQIKEQKQTIERVRDVIKKTANGAEFVLLGIESQMHIHYAMPLRHMMYDGLGYLKECEELKRGKKCGKQTTAEFLSKMSVTDRLHPIFTLTIYYGEEVWDGPFTLKDMMIPMSKKMEEQFCDYKLNLLQIRESGGYQFHHGEVKVAFQITRELLEGNIEKVKREYGEEKLSHQVMAFIGAVTSIPEFMENKNQQEEIVMCKAMDEYREKILEQGIEQGKTLIIKKMLLRNLSEAEIMEIADVTVEEINNIKQSI